MLIEDRENFIGSLLFDLWS